MPSHAKEPRSQAPGWRLSATESGRATRLRPARPLTLASEELLSVHRVSGRDRGAELLRVRHVPTERLRRTHYGEAAGGAGEVHWPEAAVVALDEALPMHPTGLPAKRTRREALRFMTNNDRVHFHRMPFRISILISSWGTVMKGPQRSIRRPWSVAVVKPAVRLHTTFSCPGPQPVWCPRLVPNSLRRAGWLAGNEAPHAPLHGGAINGPAGVRGTTWKTSGPVLCNARRRN